MTEQVRVKICGMTNRKDIDRAIQLGVDAIGLIFYPKSKRYVTIQQAQQLLQGLPPFVSVIAVMVNPTFEEVTAIQQLPVHGLQFHGHESAAFCEQFNQPFIKAIAAKSASFVEQEAARFPACSALLLDTPNEQVWGGTGETFDWQAIPTTLKKPLILAGGLNADNLLAAIETVRPYAVDICSGVEQSPGIKSFEKMQQIMTILRK